MRFLGGGRLSSPAARAQDHNANVLLGAAPSMQHRLAMFQESSNENSIPRML